jgi:hypothetical protein
MHSCTPPENAQTRRLLWRATYVGGLDVDERVGTDAPGGLRFDQLPRERLVRLALVDVGSGREAAGFDLATGRVSLHGVPLDPRVGGIALTGRGSVDPARLLQYKQAHAERRGDGSSTGTVIDFHAIGYTASLPEGDVAIELVVQPSCGHARAVCRLDRSPGASAGHPRRFVSVSGRPPPPLAEERPPSADERGRGQGHEDGR